MTKDYENDSMDEDEEAKFKTPQPLEKKKKRKKKNQDEEEEEGTSTMNITVKQISEKPDRVPPIVAYFASGYDPSSQSKSPKVTVYKHKAETRKRLQVVVSPRGSNVEFVGSNYAGEQLSRQTCVYTLGVLDKETQTLRILPIAYNKVIRLEPRVKAVESVDSGAAAEGEVSKEEQVNESERFRSLTTKFGSSKDISRDKKRHALNLGNGSEAQMSLGDDVDVNASALESTNSIVARNIPPYNVSATNPEDAYPIDKIIEYGEWNFLQDIYNLLQKDTVAETDAYPVFVRNRLHRLRDIEDEEEKQTVSGVLSLLTHFIKFKDMNSMDGRNSAKDHKFPGIIRNKCKSLFKESDTKWLAAEKINLLISYVLVLTLHVDKFKTDPEDIAKDLRISRVELRKHFDNLGCKLKVEKSVTFATLPVPLKFPQIRSRKKRR